MTKFIYTKLHIYEKKIQEVDIKLRTIIRDIFHTAYDTAKEFSHRGDLITGANIAGFRKVADSMIEQGVV